MKSLGKEQITWDLSPLFKSDNDPRIEKEERQLKKKVISLLISGKVARIILKNRLFLSKRQMNMKNGRKIMALAAMKGIIFGLRPRKIKMTPNLKPSLIKLQISAIKFKLILNFLLYQQLKFCQNFKRNFQNINH